MWRARVPSALAFLVWGWFALGGVGAMSDIAAQNVAGFPNFGQRIYYLFIPLGMTALAIVILAAPWRGRWIQPAGCLAWLLLLALPPWLIFYTGGV